MLLTAVLAAVAMVPTAWAGWGDGNYLVNDTSNIDATSDDSGSPNSFSVMAGTINEAEVSEFIMRNGQSMSVAASNGTNLALTINTLTINPAEGAEGNGSASITVNADQSLTVDAIAGSLSSVTAKGDFTYGGGGTIGTVDMGEKMAGTSPIITVKAATTMNQVNAWCGTLYVDAGSDALVTIGTYDGGKGENGVGKARGGAYVKAGSRLQINTMYYHKDNTSNAVTLEAGAVLTLGAGGLTVTGTSSEAGSLATVDRHNAGGAYSYTETNYTISNGQVKLNNGTLGNVLTNVSILHDGAGTLNLTNTSDTLKDITASAGTVAINAGLKLGGQITTSGNGEVVIKGAVVNTGMSFAENSALTVEDWTAFAGNGEYYGGAISGNGVFRGNYTVLDASSTTKADVKISYDGNVYTTDANGAVAIHDTSLFFVNAGTESVSTVTNLAATKIRMSDNTGLVIDGSIDSVSAASGANLTWTLNTTDSTTPIIGTINAGGASVTVNKDAASKSSTLSLGNIPHAVGSLTIGDGVTVTSAYAGANGKGFIDGTVTVKGGGALELQGKYATGWSTSGSIAQATDSITLTGSSTDKLATLKLGSHMVMEVTDIYLNGNTCITYTDGAGGATAASDTKGALESYGKSIVVTGTNNVSNAGLHARGGLTLNIADNATFEQAGNVYRGTNTGAITKTGGGQVTFSGDSTVVYAYKSSAGTTNFNGASTIAGSLTATAGEVNYGAGTHSVTTLDASEGGASSATITIKKDAVLSAGTIWKASHSTIKMEEGGTLKAANGVISIKGTNATDGTTLNSAVNSAYLLSGTATVNTVDCDSANFTINNADVSITSANAQEIGNVLNKSSLTNNGSGKVTAVNDANDFTGADIKAISGSIDLMNLQNGAALKNLQIDAGHRVGVYTGAEVTSSGMATVSVSGAATFGANVTLGAGLTLGDSSTLDISGTEGVTLGGALTLGSGIKLGTNLDAAIDMLTEGDSLTLFTGVTNLTYSGQTVALMSTDVAPVDAATVFAGLDTGVYEIAFAQNSVSINMLSIPEPTTATLSLLALAGLAARRRRK